MIKMECLNKSENELYFKYLDEGQTEYREKIILGNYRLVILVVKKYQSFYYELEDLINIGVIGLIKAVDSFKLEKNIAFSTYAAKCINNEIIMQFRKDKNNINILTNEIINNYDDFIKEVIADINVEKSVIDKITMEKNQIIINEAINSLTLKEKKILFEYYGINTIRKPQKEIALEYDISRTYVSRIIIKALNKIKKQLSVYDESKVLTKSKKNNKI